ncbi:MAG: hypothetical protein KBE25_10545 [Laribacter sp.]|nr:hypothetical protein [Laribacter sp.]MBP9528148.1 hypothetical protein [Laribacter sp.]MBP9609775.1 hypothetical protein [Laribacter sp.]
MKAIKHTLLFTALFAAAGVALAEGPNNPPPSPTSLTTTLSGQNKLSINNTTQYNNTDTSSFTKDDNITENIDVGFVFDPTVSKGTLASAHDTQKLLSLGVSVPDPSTTTISNSVTGNVGNVGVNNATGLFNQQANDVAMAVNQSGRGSSDKMGSGRDDEGSKTAAAAVTGYEQLVDHVTVSLGTPYPSDTSATSTTVSNSVKNNVGNVAVNATSGIGNQQKNDLAMAIDSSAALSYANAGGAQVGQFNTYSVSAGNVPLSNTASIDDSVKGNVGNTALNASAGIGNQQANGLAIATADNATLVVASAGGMQVHSNETVNTFLPLVNNASLTDSVKGNVGNVGVNLSAGIGNQQVNNVSLAVR